MSKINSSHTVYIGSDYEPEETGYGPCHAFDLIDGDTQLDLWERFSRSLTPAQEEILMQIHEEKVKEDRRKAVMRYL